MREPTNPVKSIEVARCRLCTVCLLLFMATMLVGFPLSVVLRSQWPFLVFALPLMAVMTVQMLRLMWQDRGRLW